MKKTAATIAIALCMTFALTGCKSSDYKKANELYKAGNYEEAVTMFTDLGDYEDSADMLLKAKYASAKELYDSQKYEDAEAKFEELGDYEDSVDMLLQTKYAIANGLMNEEKYEEAKAVYEELGDYEDCADKVSEATYKIMYAKYSDVVDALNGKTWYFNPDNLASLSSISFDGKNAEYNFVSFDGNGRNDSDPVTAVYTIDDSKIEAVFGTETIDLNYTMKNGKISLDEGYYTMSQVKKALRGNWSFYIEKTSVGTEQEYHLEIGKKQIQMEFASSSLLSSSEWYYYGPYKDEYKVIFGGFDTEMMHGGSLFWTIYNNEIVITEYTNAFVKGGDGVVGKDGFINW